MNLPIPSPPPHYIPRPDIEQTILNRLLSSPSTSTYIQPIIILSNTSDDISSTGKTSIVSFICHSQQIQEKYKDGILWICMNKGDHSIWTLDMLLETIAKDLSRMYNMEYSFIDYGKNKSHMRLNWENRIHDIQSIVGPTCNILLVLDGIENCALLKPLTSLGMAILATTRSGIALDNTIYVSSVLSSGNSIFDCSACDGEICGMTERNDVLSVQALIESAFLLGVDCNTTSGGRLPMVLLKNVVSLSPRNLHMFLILSPLPFNVFIPMELVHFLWESVVTHFDPVLPEDEDMEEKWSGVFDELERLSLLVVSSSKDSFLIPQESMHVLDTLATHREDIREEATSLLAFAMYDREILVSLGLDQHRDAFLYCLRSINWNLSDLLNNYSVLFEKEFERVDYNLKDLPIQLAAVVDVEKILYVVFSALSRRDADQVIWSDDETLQDPLQWVHTWTQRVLEAKSEIYSLLFDQSDISLCSTLTLHAMVSEACEFTEDSVSSRTRILDIQKASGNEEDIATSSYMIAATMFAGGCGHNDLDDSWKARVKEMESMCKKSIQLFSKQSENYTESVFYLDQAMLLLASIQSLKGKKGEDVVVTLQQVMDRRKVFHSTAYHPRVAILYYRLAKAIHALDKRTDAIHMMNKNIRITRRLYGDFNHTTADMLEFMADLYVSVENYSRAEEVLKKAIGIRRAVCSDETDASLMISLLRLADVKEKKKLESRDSVEVGERTDTLRRKVQGTLDDAALLVALADRITKKGDCAKAKKYIMKALKIISEHPSSSETALDCSAGSLPPSDMKNVIKWSAYSKLGDLHEYAGDTTLAIKFYQKALKGFLSMDMSASSRQSNHRVEAIVVAYTLATVVHNSFGFSESVGLYVQAAHILFDVVGMMDKSRDCVNDRSYGDYSRMLEEIATLFEHYETTVTINFDQPKCAVLYRPQGESIVLDSPESCRQLVSKMRQTAKILEGLEKNSQKYTSGVGIPSSNQSDRIHHSTANIDNSDIVIHRRHSSPTINRNPNEEEYYVPTHINPPSPIIASSTSPLSSRHLAKSSNTSSPSSPIREFHVPGDSFCESESSSSDAEGTDNIELPGISTGDETFELSNRSSTYIFVFGSMRRHQLNHNIIRDNEGVSYLGTTATSDKYYMYVNARTGLPFVTVEPVAGIARSIKTTIIGEVYFVPYSVFANAKHLFISGMLQSININAVDDSMPNEVITYISDSSCTPDSSEILTIPRGNYSQFLSARGGIDSFLSSSKSRLRRASTGGSEKTATKLGYSRQDRSFSVM